MSSLLSIPARGASILLDKAQDILLAPGSVFSVISLASALAIAVLTLTWGRRRRPRLAALRRALFPRWLTRGPSTRADLGLMLFNSVPAAMLLGWALISANDVAGATVRLLGEVLPTRPAGMAAPAARVIATVALFLAYELAYWIDHWLSHRVPLLWDFHKAHHTAQSLTPLTAFRVHPIDSLVFANIVAVVVGVTGGILTFSLGRDAAPFALSGTNLLLVAFVFLTVHLQHSHLWISFTGLLGRILISPAHHQVHHSGDPAHFNRNFGSCLAVWDWLFGTLHVPSRRREPLNFGAETDPHAAAPHSAKGLLLTPFSDAARRLWLARRGPVIN